MLIFELQAKKIICLYNSVYPLKRFFESNIFYENIVMNQKNLVFFN